MEKLPPGCGFFDLNELWYFPNRWAVKALYPLPVTANHITVLALIFGLISAAFYFSSGEHALIWGAVFLYGKLFCDNVDGNLARLRGEASRLGRFLDSFSDFLVTVLVYAGVTWQVAKSAEHPGWIWTLGLLALASALLHCSYWVYYYVSYASRVGSYEKNRTDESLTEEERGAYEETGNGTVILALQRIHNFVYGWQDALIETVDRTSRKWARVPDTQQGLRGWYEDAYFLVGMGPMCICTNTMALIGFSLIDQLWLFLHLVVYIGNAYWVGLHVWKIHRFKVAEPGEDL
ncbi:CDP-alcohol phosphatidyltransferase family protein [Nitrospina watsonii]|uniref:CDP-alcohol phosphatidyltransferase n=1 Tax=Nitrospina watsonii TaxID=1323948 RepID=A0ABM9HGF0_9BACT|nr:CDP-alcohol phosphatidyltransferase family protein [Nitrospina watsonii]CAI2719263.1 conserved membrane protein of unknown function [Nitrospina watsonii]